jgi:molybdate transport system substrate-binding protein
MPLSCRRKCLQWISILPFGIGNVCSYAQAVPTIAAASDLKFPLEELAGQFEKSTGHKLRLIFGSSGNFYTQIMQGAPFHLFMSADQDFIYKLTKAGKTQDQGRIYAKGRIGIMVPTYSPLKPDGQLNDLAAALQDGRLQKFAIANPAHAPYGSRAQEALRKVGLWDAIKSKLVLGENVSQAAQFATSGSTQGGIIAQSLALAPAIAKLGRFDLIPEDWHQPLVQRMALMKDAPSSVKAFYDFLSHPSAQVVMGRFGFVMPKQ